jgi:hypothetical protein
LRVAYGARDHDTHNKESIDQLEFAFQAAVLMADTNKPAPAPAPPDKIQPLPTDAFFSEKRGNGATSAENQ